MHLIIAIFELPNTATANEMHMLMRGCDSRLCELLGDSGIVVDAFMELIDSSADIHLASAIRSDSMSPFSLGGLAADLHKKDLDVLEGITPGADSQLSEKCILYVLAQIPPDQLGEACACCTAVYHAAAYPSMAPAEDHQLGHCYQLHSSAANADQGPVLAAWGLRHFMDPQLVVVPIQHADPPHWSVGVIDQWTATMQHLDLSHDPARRTACLQELLTWASNNVCIHGVHLADQICHGK